MQFEAVGDILRKIKRRMEDAKEDLLPQYKENYMCLCDALKSEDFN
jgi:hypothetical protein